MTLVRDYSALLQDELQTPHVGDVIQRIGADAAHFSATTDPDARLLQKGPGKEARLVFMGHSLMENRDGLIIDAVTTRASGPCRAARCDRPDRAACRPTKSDHAGRRQGL